MYITQENYTLALKEGLKPIFERAFNWNAGELALVKMRHEGDITNRDMAIVKYLYKVRYATFDQLVRLVAHKIPESGNIENRLKVLSKYNVINTFILGDDSINNFPHFPQDAKRFYCLDAGGKHLIENFDDSEDTESWYVGKNIKPSETISRHLIMGEFYLQLLETLESKLIYFNAYQKVTYNKSSFTPTFEFALNVDGRQIYFLGDVVRDNDVVSSKYRERVEQMVEILNGEKEFWRKVFLKATHSPALIVIGESEETALDAAKILTHTFGFGNFRTSSPQRLALGISSDHAIGKYSEEKDKLVSVKTTAFQPA